MAQANDQTGIVNLGSTLERKKWMLEGMLQKSSQSQWDGLKGNSKESIVFTTTDISKKDGHEVEFQWDGNASGRGVKGKERLRGNEEQKKQFSDKIRVSRVRHGLDNGDDFDAVNIGNLNLSQHTHSRSLLGDWNVRKRDQWLFDAGQGFLAGNANTHIIRPNDRAGIADLVAGDVMDMDFLMDMEAIIKTGRDFTVGGDRAPMRPFKLADGRSMWMLMIDPWVHRDFIKNSVTQNILGQADVRGNDNRLIKSVLGTIGSFMIVDKLNYFGKTYDNSLTGSEVEISGLRQVHESGVFTGETGFDGSGVIASRSLILGAGALQVADGKSPDYLFEESDDYGITSGSGMEMWTNTQATVLYADNEDYADAKQAGYHYGICAVDTFARTNA